MRLLAATLLGAALQGQTVTELLSTLSSTKRYQETAVSPDGCWLAWTAGKSASKPRGG